MILSTCPNCHEPIFPDDIYCGNCGQTLAGAAVAPPVSPVGGAQIRCPSCGHLNEPDAIYCEIDGTPLKAAPTPPPPPPPQAVGVLVLPDQTEISIAQARRTVGRADVVRYISPADRATEVGRAHFTITQENGIFYLQDGGPDPANPQTWKPSLNKTYLNDEELREAEKRQLKAGDVIDVARLVRMTFKTRQP
jgi:hypothetical protein